MDCGNKRREPPPPSADRSHYNGADCQKKYVRQSCQEIFALDIPFIELLITPELLLLAPFLLNGECAVVYSVGLQFTCYCGLSVAKGE